MTLESRSSFGAALLLASVIGCSPDHPPPNCGHNQPAFRLQLTAAEGELPADTRLVVGYSGSRQEAYSLVAGGPMNTDVCCRAGDPTTGRLPDVRCGLPPPLSSSTQPPGPIPDASSSPPPDVSTSPPPDGAPPAPPDATSPAIGDAALALRDGAARASREAGLRDAATAHLDAGRDAARAPSGPVALLCDLWTDGYADISLTASGYPDFEHPPFEANVPVPQCGVVTVDLRIELGHNDAGVSP